jgi:hypothetical protein
VESVTDASEEDADGVIDPVDLEPPQAGPSSARRSRTAPCTLEERIRELIVEGGDADFDVVMCVLVLPGIPFC